MRKKNALSHKTSSGQFEFIENSHNFIFVSRDNVNYIILCDLFRGYGEYQ